jgi:hypothetical protein
MTGATAGRLSGAELALQKTVLQLSLAWRSRLTFVRIASGLFALHLFDCLL